MKRPLIAVVIVVSMLALLAACGAKTTGDDTAGRGTLTGTITIGPVCPVEPCGQPAGAIYVGRELKLLRSGASLISVPLGADGSFSVSLEPSTYVIRLDACNFLGCAQAFPVEKTIAAGETVVLNVDLDTGIRSAERPPDLALLVSDLVGLGAVVAQGGDVSQPFFSVQGEEIMVGRETVQVFSYGSPEAAQADADLVGETGSTVGTSMVSWIAPPHFYLKDRLLVLYVGNASTVINLLQQSLGAQFAGGENPGAMAVPPEDPTANPDAQVESYLGLMDDLAGALRSFSTPDGRGASMDRVIEVATQLEDYAVFFAALGGDRMTYVMDTYGERLRESAERVAGIAATAYEITGDETIPTLLQRLPAFAVVSSSTDRSGSSGDPIIVERAAPPADILLLLRAEEVAVRSDGAPIAVEYRDGKAAAAEVDPAQVERMDSFWSFDFATEDGSRGLVLSVIDFDSEGAATDHLGLMTDGSGMQSINTMIGDDSAYLEVNQSGIGSMVVFRKGEWVVSLHTAQADGTDPLVDVDGVIALARLVVGRL